MCVTLYSCVGTSSVEPCLLPLLRWRGGGDFVTTQVWRLTWDENKVRGICRFIQNCDGRIVVLFVVLVPPSQKQRVQMRQARWYNHNPFVCSLDAGSGSGPGRDSRGSETVQGSQICSIFVLIETTKYCTHLAITTLPYSVLLLAS